jgi:predicted transcriptional regulator
MSDMATDRITVRVPASLNTRLRHLSRAKRQSPSDLVRVALQNYIEDQKYGDQGSAYEVAKAAGLIGCVKGLPKDLSANKKYFEGFGKSG